MTIAFDLWSPYLSLEWPGCTDSGVLKKYRGYISDRPPA